MKKNAEQAEEKKLVWKLAEKPSGHVVAELVAQGVIDKGEARSILFREEVEQSDEVEALKKMVKTLQEMVKNLLARPSGVQLVPYTQIIEVPRRMQPYWERTWMGSGTLNGYVETTRRTSGNNTVYAMSVGQ
jgi:hypothetical protein